MQYKIEIAETVDGKVEWWETAQRPASGEWTADSAVRWCRIDWPDTALVPANARARIMRRRGPRSSWVQYRQYVIQPNGIVRRTDR